MITRSPYPGSTSYNVSGDTSTGRASSRRCNTINGDDREPQKLRNPARGAVVGPRRRWNSHRSWFTDANDCAHSGDLRGPTRRDRCRLAKLHVVRIVRYFQQTGRLFFISRDLAKSDPLSKRQSCLSSRLGHQTSGGMWRGVMWRVRSGEDL